MKLSSIPEARLDMINRALAEFFAGNNLPAVQITGRRARVLKHWFETMLSSQRMNVANLSWPSHYGNGQAENQRIGIVWRQYNYDEASDTESRCRHNTRCMLKDLGALKLPDYVANDARRMHKVNIDICHLWESKQFQFLLTSK